MLETLDIVQEQVAQDGKVVQLEQDHQKEQVKKTIVTCMLEDPVV